jgi:hypothetical protein
LRHGPPVHRVVGRLVGQELPRGVHVNVAAGIDLGDKIGQKCRGLAIGERVR